MGFFEGEPVPVRPSSSVFPFFLRPASPSSASTASFSLSRRQGPSFPRRSPSLPLRRSRGPSVGGEPNHALQRTEAGGRAFSAIHASSRQPPSLSLDSLGPGRHRCPPSCSSGALPDRPCALPGRSCALPGRSCALPGRWAALPGRAAALPGRRPATAL